MRKALRILLAAGALVLATSCYYNPYDYGYSDAYGYSGAVSTSFVYTSSDRWLYDPVVRCYYDRHRSCYYDPWAGGYYARGYCPRPVRGVPHPYGWNGRGKCPTPRNVRYHHLNRNHDRIAHYRSRNYPWASQVHHHGHANNQAWRQNRLHAAANHQRHRTVPGNSRGNQPRQPQWTVRNRPDGQSPGWTRPGRQQPNIQSPRGPSRPGFSGNARGPSTRANPPAVRPGYNQPVSVNRNQPRAAPRQPTRTVAPRPQPRPQPANSGNVFDRRREAFKSLQGRLTRN